MTDKTTPKKPKYKEHPYLIEWLNSLPKQTQDMFAKRMGTSTGQLRQIGRGVRSCNAALAVEIDKKTAGRISMVDMHPDIDWEHVKLFIHER